MAIPLIGATITWPLIQQILPQTIFLAVLYAVMGVGFVILFRATGVINFAQGMFMLLGALLFYTLLVEVHLSFWLACLGSIVACALISAGIYFVLFYRLAGAALFAVIVATMGLSIALQALLVLIWNPDVKEVPEVLGGPASWIAPLGLHFSRFQVLTIVVAIALVVGLQLGLQRSLLGVRIRAVASSPLLAALNRVNVPLLSGVAWAVAGVCSAVAGIAIGVQTAVDPTNLPTLGLFVFPVVIIGGVDSVPGAIVGGFAAAFIQNAATLLVNGNWVFPAVYIALLVTLLIRPRGLFGSREIVRI